MANAKTENWQPEPEGICRVGSLAACAFACARRAMRPLSLIMFDIDGFKQINDARGHLQGDAPVTASIGVGVSAAGALDAKAFMARVDMSLYDAKRSGRNRFCVASQTTGRPPAAEMVGDSALPLAQGE